MAVWGISDQQWADIVRKQNQEELNQLQTMANAGDLDAKRELAQKLSEQERAGTADWRQELSADQIINPERYNIDTQGMVGTRDYLGLQAPTINTAQSNQIRGQQLALANMLQGQAAGTAPSIAEQQLKAGTDANIAQQMALAKSLNGNTSLAQRQAMTGAADAQQTMAQQAALAKIQEQQAAQQSLASLLSGARTQDLTGETANLTAATNILGTGIGAQSAQEQANINAALGREQLRLQENQGANQFNLGAFNTTQGVGQQGGGDVWSGLGSFAGGFASLFSDEDLKENVTDASGKLGKFLSNIEAHEYEYKDKKMGKGKFVSPMAQELEKSDLGKGMVEETPQGKAVNYNRGLGLMLAAQGYLNDRLDKIETALNKRGK